MLQLHRIRSFATVICLMGLVSACAGPIQHATPSGKVEVTINNVTKKTVKDKLVDTMVNMGFIVTKSDDNVVVADRPNPTAMIFGTNIGTPVSRITLQLVQNGKTVRVIADCAVIASPNTAYENRIDMNGNADTARLQTQLDYIKGDLERK